MMDATHPLGKLANFRDLGNLAGVNGTIRPGVLFRSDDLSTIDDAEAERVASMDISLIIDLRSSDEVSQGRGPLERYDMDYLNLPLLERSGTSHNLEDLVASGGFTHEMLGLWYAEVFSRSLSMIVEGLHAVSEARGGVVFHCAIGKDRTGIFAVALHSALGIHREHILRDFVKTEDNLPQVLARLSASQPFWTAEVIKKSGALLRAHPEAMTVFLDQVDSTGDSLEARLLQGGATPALFHQLRAMALIASGGG
jgi:protein-tyrosine phosphatase